MHLLINRMIEDICVTAQITEQTKLVFIFIDFFDKVDRLRADAQVKYDKSGSVN